MKALRFFVSFLWILNLLGLNDISAQENQKMDWFRDARLGIFIHWGIYSVDGIDESWSFFNEYVSHETYMKQLNGFTATNFNPEKWADLIASSGAKYTVITSKHHDGVALWNTRCNDLSIVKKTPAAKDVLTPFVAAARQKGLKTGIYFSLLDWSHPDYPNLTRTQKRYTSDSARWNRFVDFNFCQLNELVKQYNPDLFWFDGDWEQNADAWKAKEIRKMILQHNPDAIINSRLAGYGDYDTPEQGVPVLQPAGQFWELCLTMNDSWGYQPNDKNYKSTDLIIRILADCITLGGNLLLDIGPKPDGSVPAEQISILEELGKWTSKHKEAVYGTKPGIPFEYFKGNTALSADSTILYLFVEGTPSMPLIIKGLKNKINRIRVVGDGTKLSWNIVGKLYWSEVPGLVLIDLPKENIDPHLTVIAVQLDGPVNLNK